MNTYEVIASCNIVLYVNADSIHDAQRIVQKNVKNSNGKSVSVKRIREIIKREDERGYEFL